jgi:uncharacterized small protein (DUF1192 family)
MQLYDIKEDKGYPEPEIVPDELGSYYRAEEVDEHIAALTAETANLKCCGNCLYYLRDDGCPKDKIDDGKTVYPEPNSVCRHWEWDGMTAEKRKEVTHD